MYTSTGVGAAYTVRDGAGSAHSAGAGVMYSAMIAGYCDVSGSCRDESHDWRQCCGFFQDWCDTAH